MFNPNDKVWTGVAIVIIPATQSQKTVNVLEIATTLEEATGKAQAKFARAFGDSISVNYTVAPMLPAWIESIYQYRLNQRLLELEGDGYYEGGFTPSDAGDQGSGASGSAIDSDNPEQKQ